MPQTRGIGNWPGDQSDGAPGRDAASWGYRDRVATTRAVEGHGRSHGGWGSGHRLRTWPLPGPGIQRLFSGGTPAATVSVNASTLMGESSRAPLSRSRVWRADGWTTSDVVRREGKRRNRCPRGGYAGPACCPPQWWRRSIGHMRAGAGGEPYPPGDSEATRSPPRMAPILSAAAGHWAWATSGHRARSISRQIRRAFTGRGSRIPEPS